MTRLTILLAALAACDAVSAQPAPGQQFTILIYESTDSLAARTDSRRADAYWASYDELAGTLIKAGVLRGGSALSEDAPSMIRGSAGASGSARLGGYFVIEVADLAAAKQFAAKVPAFGAAVEVRPHRPNPRMKR